MMIRNRFFALAALMAVSSVGYSQTGGAKKNDPGEVEITFVNGSVVRMALLPDDIEIQTEFGKLSVPVRQIRRVEFGLHFPDGVEKKVEAAIKSLSSTQYKEREGAVGELVKLGAYAYPALLKAAKGGEPESTKRVQDAIAKIRAKVPAKDLHLGEDDKIVTPRFTIVGRITTTSIKAKSEYFGDAEHALTKLRHLRLLADARETDVAVDAAKYAMGDQWLDTGVSVESAATLTISASGELDLRPTLPGNYVCGPRGYTRNAAIGGFAGGKVAKGKAGLDAPARAYPGTLLGRVGANGETFIIGDRFEGPPERDGKLYLQIVSSLYDTSSLGTYQVKISVRD
jgi:hypothetical protein